MLSISITMLRGLPSTEIVGHALRHHHLFKHASEIFLERPPDEAAASVLIEAFEAGNAPAWLTAHLLGCLRAPAGYVVVRRILIDAPGGLAESYAGPALARIAGPAARADLLDLVRRGRYRRVREGALYGLAELGDKGVVPTVLEAVRDRLVGRGAAGSAVLALGVSGVELVVWLRSPDEDARHVAIDAVIELSAMEGRLQDVALATAALEAVRAGAVRLSPSMRSRLEERLGKALSSHELRRASAAPRRPRCAACSHCVVALLLFALRLAAGWLLRGAFDLRGICPRGAPLGPG